MVAVAKTQTERAPDLPMVIAPVETLASCKVTRFRVFVVIDKSRRIRYIGLEGFFDPDEPIEPIYRTTCSRNTTPIGQSAAPWMP